MADLKISQLTGATTPLAGTEVLPIVQSGATKQVSIANVTAGRSISTTGITVSSNTGDIELNWAAGSTHKVGSTFSTSFFTGMRVTADTRNTDIISFDASGNGNVRLRTGTTETTRLNVDPTGNVTINTGNVIIGTSGQGIDFSATPGTGTSELLADYEEGTWTPSVGGNATYFLQEGKYTKVGKIVYVSGTVVVDILGTGSATTISGLPFAATNAPAGFVGFANFASLALAVTYISGRASGSSTIVIVSTLVAATSVSSNNIIGNGTRLDFSCTYLA